MSLSFHDLSAVSYLQTLRATAAVLERGREYLLETGPAPDEVAGFRLREDMAPFSFQVVSVWHHSLGALRGMQAGVFTPPPGVEDTSYAGLQTLIAEAIDGVAALDPEEVNALSGRAMVFRLGATEIPFTTDNFLTSFSLPNLHFHATTTYAVLRMHGVPLGKRDYLGEMRIGA